MSAIWEKDRYQADILTLTNKTIIEYDMKSANTSLAREFKLLPEDKISEIEALGKQSRVVAIGKLMRDDKEFADKLKASFMEARRLFFEENELEDDEVITIKRDAIFVTRYVEHMEIGEHILFRPKNQYTSFIHLKPFEIYYSSDGLDIKGMDDEIYKRYHKDYFGDFLSGVIRRLETSSKKETLRYIRSVFDSYKWLELDPGYYREFSNTSQFRYLDGRVSMEEYMQDLTQLDISNNFKLINQLLMTIL